MQKKHNLKFSTDATLKQAKANIIKKYHEVEAHNIAYAAGKETFMKANYETDWMSEKEFLKFRTGSFESKLRFKRSAETAPMDTSICTNVATAKNWVDLNKVAPVQNQGGCGCCYIFGNLGAIESAVAINYNTTVTKLSEQHICLNALQTSAMELIL